MVATTVTVVKIDEDDGMATVMVDGEERFVDGDGWAVGDRGVYVEDGYLQRESGGEQEDADGKLLPALLGRMPTEDGVDVAESIGFHEYSWITQTREFMAEHGRDPLRVSAVMGACSHLAVNYNGSSTAALVQDSAPQSWWVWVHVAGGPDVLQRMRDSEGRLLSRREVAELADQYGLGSPRALRNGVLNSFEQTYAGLAAMYNRACVGRGVVVVETVDAGDEKLLCYF